MRRNPFFHAPAADEPATFTNTLVDLLGGLAIFAFAAVVVILASVMS
jgi:hypothetical protein